MSVLLSASYAVHVIAAAFWTGAVLYAAYAVFPAAEAGEMGAEAFAATVDKLLRVTRWTGLALPVTGVYQVWVLYPLDRLLGTTDGYLVLAMAGIWTLMNGLLEVGIWRMRTIAEPVSLGRYLTEGYRIGGGVTARPIPEVAAVGRPYVLVAVVLAVALLVDAALLAGGVPV